MINSDRLNRWLTLGANVGILAGLILVAMQIDQNTQLARTQLVNEGNIALNELWGTVAGENPMQAVAKSIENPQSMTFADFLVADMILSANITLMYRKYELAQEGIFEDAEWKKEVERLVPWFLANDFGRTWWREEEGLLLAPEFVAYVDKQLESGQALDSQAYWLRIKKRLKEE